MIIIVAHEQKDWRATQIAVTLKEWKESEPIMLDDTTATFADLEGYCYPSLFSLSVPIVHAKYLLPTAVAQFNTTLVKNLSASPTVFLFEEFALATPIATAAKKYGAIVHVGEKVSKKKSEDMFGTVSGILTARDKKSRWMAYRSVLDQQPIEAFIGILYWKARQMNSGVYEKLLDAQARAWQTGAPLELLIEKVLLE
jgi:hypothetical protein